MAIVVVIIFMVSSILLKWAPPEEDEGPGPDDGNDLKKNLHFDGGVANLTVWAQEHMGYRIPGSEASARLRNYLSATLVGYGWNVTLQPFHSPELNLTLTNLIAKRGPDNGTGNASTPLYMLGAHYDTRPYNDREEQNVEDRVPIPGANDGASGVSALLELARATQNVRFENEVWLAFFDGEDHGPLDDKMFLGSRNFSRELDQTTVDRTRAFVLLDMIGDVNLTIPREVYSDPELLDEVFSIAEALEESAFLNETGYRVVDDHVQVAARGIPAIDLIDFDYGSKGPGGKYWHTLADNRTKVSGESLASVGRVVEAWLKLKATNTTRLEDLPEVVPPPSQDITVIAGDITGDEKLYGPGLYVVKDILVQGNVTLHFVNATVALEGTLTLGPEAKLILEDSIMAATDNDLGLIPAERVQLAPGALVEWDPADSEWWGPDLN